METCSDDRPPSALDDVCEQQKELASTFTTPTDEASEQVQDVEHESDEVEQKVATLQEKNEELKSHNVQLVNKVKELKASLKEKRERLWDEIQDFQDALGEKKRELQDALDSKARHRREAAALREELSSLHKLLEEKDTSLVQVVAKAKEEVRLAEVKQAAQTEELASLRQLLRTQQTSFEQARQKTYDETRQAEQKQAILQEEVEQLEQRLKEQAKAFEEERARLLKHLTIRQVAQEELEASLDEAMPQLRSLLSAYERVRGSSAAKQKKTTCCSPSTCTTITQVSSSGLAQRLQEQHLAFNQERELMVQQANDEAKTQQDIARRSLMEREAVLTCPISLELFDFPVVTGCCGKTFSSDALMQAVNQSPLCPLCRGPILSTHPNRDMTKMVELHKAERLILGVPEAESPVLSPTASQNHEYARISTETHGRTHHSRRHTGSSSTRERRHRDHRSQRVQARAVVPHHQSLRTSTQARAVPDATSSVASNPSGVETTVADTSRQVAPSGLTITRIGPGGVSTPVPRHLVRSVLASLRFSSPQSRSTGRRVRPRSGMSMASLAEAHQLSQPATSRRRAPRSSAVPSATSSVTTTAATTAVSSITSNSGVQSRNRSAPSRPTPSTGTAFRVPTSAASVGAILSTLPSNATSSVSSSATSALRGSQATRPSRASNTSALVAVSGAAPMTTPSATSTIASHRAARFSASQDDSALGRPRHDSLRLTASQPAPREPLSVIAKSISSLKDLLGSDFEDSDSNSNG